MENNMRKVTFLSVFALVLLLVPTAWAQAPTGRNFQVIDVKDPGAGLAADFAIKERAAKAKQGLKLVAVAKAESEGGKGSKIMYTLFRLCINYDAAGKPSSGQAIVSVDAYSNHKLVTWKAVKCGEPEGDYQPVPNDNAGVGLAANFAVDKHSADMKVKHTIDSILKAEVRGMFAPTYRICMKVGEQGNTQMIRTVVSMDQYSNMKLVSWEHSDCGKN